MIRALIVDDERLARTELRELLKAHPEIDVIGEASNAPQARENIQLHHPDLVFLDIQMPKESGFDLIDSLKGECPSIIFTTAYDDYALRAFEFAAVDYLLKPISSKRLAQAVNRLSSDSENQPQDEEQNEEDDIRNALQAEDRILLGAGDSLIFAAVKDIKGAESIGPHSVLWLESGSVAVKRSLSSIEKRFPSKLFFRANRTQLVNIKNIIRIEPWFSNCLLAVMDNEKKIEFSRRQSHLFKESQSL